MFCPIANKACKEGRVVVEGELFPCSFQIEIEGDHGEVNTDCAIRVQAKAQYKIAKGLGEINSK